MLDRKIVRWVGMAAVPGVALAANGAGVGQIIESSGTSVDGTLVPGQGMVVPGNVLTTDSQGRALVEFSEGAQINVLESSSLTFKSGTGYVRGEMASGTVAARSVAKDPVTIETPLYKIEPAQQGRAVYVVAMLPDKTTLVSATEGPVSITQMNSGRRYVVAEGRYAKLAGPGEAVSPDDQQQAPPPGERPPGLLTTPTGLFILAVGSGTAVAITLDKTILAPSPVSPAKP